MLIDLQTYCNALLDDNAQLRKTVTDDQYLTELFGLADLLELWMMRDIRLVVTPRSKTNAKKASRQPSWCDAFRLSTRSPRALPSKWATGDSPLRQKRKQSIPPATSAVSQAALTAICFLRRRRSVHAFLTRDTRVLEQAELTGPTVAILSPRNLADRLAAADVSIFFGGVCGGNDCPYAHWEILAPDTGNWSGLLTIFDD